MLYASGLLLGCGAVTAERAEGQPERPSGAVRAARAQLAGMLPHPDGRTLTELVMAVNLIFLAGQDWQQREFYRSLGLVLPARVWSGA